MSFFSKISEFLSNKEPNLYPDSKLIKTLDGHNSPVVSLAVTPNGNMLISADKNENIKFWKLPEGELIKTLEGGGNGSVLALTPDGSMLITGGNKINFWKLPEGELVNTIDVENKIWDFSLSADGKILVSGDSYAFKIWDLPDGNLINTITSNKRFGYFTITDDGKILITEFDKYSIRLLNLPNGELIKDNNCGTTLAVAKTPDGKHFITSAESHTYNGYTYMRLFSLPEGEMIKSLAGEPYGHKSFIFAIAITPDGKMLISGGVGKSLKVWNLPEGKVIKTLEGHNGAIYAATVTPDGKSLVSGSDDKTIKIWSLPEVV